MLLVTLVHKSRTFWYHLITDEETWVIEDKMPKELIALLPGQKYCSRCCSLKVQTQRRCKEIQPLARLLPKSWSHMAPQEFISTNRDHAHDPRTCLHLYSWDPGVSQEAVGAAAAAVSPQLSLVPRLCHQARARLVVTPASLWARNALLKEQDGSGQPLRIAFLFVIVETSTWATYFVYDASINLSINTTRTNCL